MIFVIRTRVQVRSEAEARCYSFQHLGNFAVRFTFRRIATWSSWQTRIAIKTMKPPVAHERLHAKVKTIPSPLSSPSTHHWPETSGDKFPDEVLHCWVKACAAGGSIFIKQHLHQLAAEVVQSNLHVCITCCSISDHGGLLERIGVDIEWSGNRCFQS